MKIKTEIYKKTTGFVGFFKPQNEPMVINELHQKCQGVKIISRAKEASVFETDKFENLLSSVEELSLVYLLHLHPVHIKCQCTTAEIAAAGVQLIEFLEKGDNLTCQCKIVAEKRMDFTSGEVVAAVGEAFGKKGFTLTPETANTALSVTIFDDSAYVGLSLIKHNLSPWTGGVLFYAKNDDIMCRAEFKLEEAFKVFGVKLSNTMKALDLGAAPGGWTHFLAGKGVKVDAVDPTKLSPQAGSMKGVRHFKMTAQEFADECEDDNYDIIVNDMKMEANESIDITCEMAKRLNSSGFCLLTLKLPKTGGQKKINTARSILERNFGVVKIRQLYYNRSEVTCFLKNK